MLSRFPSVLVIALAALGAFAPLIVAAFPRLGLGVLYRLSRVRLAMAIASLGLATNSFIRWPSPKRGLVLAITVSLNLAARFFDARRFFVAVDRPPHDSTGDASLSDDALVLGLGEGAGAIAWPLELVAPHHLINDLINDRVLRNDQAGERAVLVSY